MEKIKLALRKRYFLYAVVIVICFIASIVFLQYFIKEQRLIIDTVQKSRKQIATSRIIIKNVENYNSDNFQLEASEPIIDLVEINKNLAAGHKVLNGLYQNQLFNKGKFKEQQDSIFSVGNIKIEKLVKLTNTFSPNTTETLQLSNSILNTTKSYIKVLNTFIDQQHLRSKNRLNIMTRAIIIVLLVLSAFIVYGFVILLRPILKDLVNKNNELNKLRQDIELTEQYNKVFIEQSPNSIAMLDKNMVYLAVSQQWLMDYNLAGKEVIGRSHYQVFPEIGEAWKEQHKKCLNGAIDKCDEALFVRSDGTEQWIFWDVRPWYGTDGKVGGLLMYTGDITDKRKDRIEKDKIINILAQTKEIARIGTWEVDVDTGLFNFGKVAREILKLKEGEELSGFSAFSIYKEGANRIKIENAINNLMNTGEPFDLDFEIINGDGETVWIREIGKADYENNKLKRLYGIFQDISKVKETEHTLTRQNELLTFAEQITMMGHWHWNVKTDKIIWSPNLYTIMDIEPGTISVSPRTILDMTHPDDKEVLEVHMKTTLSKKKFEEDFIHRIVTKKGEIKFVHVIAKVILDSDGEISEIVGSSQDITQQRMEEIKFRGLLESAPDAMVIVNENKIIQLVNKEAEKLFGYTTNELLGHELSHIISEEFNLIPEDNLEEQLENAKGLVVNKDNVELYVFNKVGKYIPVQISLSPLETAQGLLISIALRDMTERKKAEQKIISANESLRLLTEKLKTQNVQLADFAQITSHNLRAPVSNLNSLLDLYHITDKEEDRKIVFNKLEKVIENLSLTLNTLVEALKVKNEEVVRQNVKLSKALESAKDMLAAEIIKTETEIISNFDDVDSIPYNKIYLESIFLNLVSNAIKYRSKKKNPIIEIKSYIEDGKPVLSFSDNGLGIDLNKHGQKLFGLNKVFHRHPEAKGVGLFITKMQIESMGGSISVESTVNKGTTFTIKLS